MARTRLTSVLFFMLQLAVAFSVSLGLCAFLAHRGGFPPTVWPEIAGVGSMLILEVVIITRWQATRGGSRAIGCVIAFATFILFQAELITLRHFQPRPVFHNHFGLHEFSFVPYWSPDHTEIDEFGQYVRSDYRDNLLAVVLTGASPGADQPWGGGMTEYSVCVGDKEAIKTITLPRIQNAFVLVLPDGTHRQFPLGPGGADFLRLHLRMPGGRIKNLLRASRDVLDAASKAQFDAAVANYREPLPPRPVFHHEHNPENPPTPPYWRLTPPRTDSSGNSAWADYEDNLLVIVKDAIRSGEKGSGYYYADHFDFLYGGVGSRDGWVEVPRARNVMIVIRPDRTTKQFPLDAGVAERFHRSKSEGNLLHEAAGLLSKPARTEFEEFSGQQSTASASRPE